MSRLTDIKASEAGNLMRLRARSVVVLSALSNPDRVPPHDTGVRIQGWKNRRVDERRPVRTTTGRVLSGSWAASPQEELVFSSDQAVFDVEHLAAPPPGVVNQQDDDAASVGGLVRLLHAEVSIGSRVGVPNGLQILVNPADRPVLLAVQVPDDILVQERPVRLPVPLVLSPEEAGEYFNRVHGDPSTVRTYGRRLLRG